MTKRVELLFDIVSPNAYFAYFPLKDMGRETRCGTGRYAGIPGRNAQGDRQCAAFPSRCGCEGEERICHAGNAPFHCCAWD